MNSFDSQWNRLLRAARRAPSGPAAELPLGFPTRVAARGLAVMGAGRRESLLEIASVRALGLACTLMVAAVAINYPAVRTLLATEGYVSDTLPLDEETGDLQP